MDLLAGFTSWLFDEGFDAISIYLSSLQNFRRKAHEITAMCDAEAVFCRDLLPNVIAKHGASTVVAGEVAVLPDTFKRTLRELQQSVTAPTAKRIYLCVAYCPIQEIRRATLRAGTREIFVEHLDVPEPLDLVVRTGGSNLISNFLPLQAGFARLYFLEKLFNDVERKDLEGPIASVRGLTRLYGE